MLSSASAVSLFFTSGPRAKTCWLFCSWINLLKVLGLHKSCVIHFSRVLAERRLRVEQRQPQTAIDCLDAWASYLIWLLTQTPPNSKNHSLLTESSLSALGNIWMLFWAS